MKLTEWALPLSIFLSVALLAINISLTAYCDWKCEKGIEESIGTLEEIKIKR